MHEMWEDLGPVKRPIVDNDPGNSLNFGGMIT